MANAPTPSAHVNGDSNIPEYKLWRSGDPLDYVQTMPQNEGSPLDQIYKRMKQYDQNMFDAWRDEIEHLLIFAGLFSATVTAFIVDSYKWLQEDFGAKSATLLAQISRQLDAMANNATSPAISETVTFTPIPRSVRVNILWFSSLILCLSTVIFGILCLQWLREYTRDMSLSQADAVTIRQMRSDGLYLWNVPALIAWLPAVLQLSVLLFFAGVLDLLWSIHRTVAIVITVVVGVTVAGIVFTTVAPVIQTMLDFHHFGSSGYDPRAYVQPCPYRSPISWIALRFMMHVDPALFGQLKERDSWAAFDIFYHERSMDPSYGRKSYNIRGLARALQWIVAKLSPELNQDISRDVYHSLHEGVDKTTSGKVLLDWATDTGEIYKMKTILEETRRTGMYPAQYDLLMERLLRKCSPVHDNRKVLLELQVRCLNTLGDKDKEGMEEVFSEAAKNCYYYSKEIKDSTRLSGDGLAFQSLMTLLKFYHRFYETRKMPNVPDLIGSALARAFRSTSVNEDNVSICRAILYQFKLMLEEVYESAADLSAPSPPADLNPVVHLLRKIDLREVERWENDISKITGKETGVCEGMVSFLEKLPAVLQRTGQDGEAGELKAQLDAFHEDYSYNYVHKF